MNIQYGIIGLPREDDIEFGSTSIFYQGKTNKMGCTFSIFIISMVKPTFIMKLKDK